MGSTLKDFMAFVSKINQFFDDLGDQIWHNLQKAGDAFNSGDIDDGFKALGNVIGDSAKQIGTAIGTGIGAISDKDVRTEPLTGKDEFDEIGCKRYQTVSKRCQFFGTGCDTKVLSTFSDPDCVERTAKAAYDVSRLVDIANGIYGGVR
jgi:hypothetical protein